MSSLGPFQLEEPLGKGGMGVVWRARHGETDTPIAIKLIRPGRTAARWQEAFRREVRAMARLVHPGIVTVYDYGEVGASDTEIAPSGTPWVAMELASHGALDDHPFPVRWETLRGLLLELLDALAHAHARGLVHRDIKPGNVLLHREGDRLRAKLTDFGVARAITSGRMERNFAGTPDYAAPEQIEGRRRDEGPWTDLYAVGGMAWQLATGRTPFSRGSLLATVRAQVNDHLPPFRPRLPVPDGFAKWLGVLLAKRPDRRYAKAADAAFALLQLNTITGAPAGRQHPEAYASTLDSAPDLHPPEGPTLTSDAHDLTRVFTVLETFADAPPTMATRETDEPLSPTPPPMVSTWHRDEPAPHSSVLAGAGLGLYFMRTLPLVGRDSERDVIWAELEKVVHDGSSRVVALSGPTGVGKTRLAQWIAERADELGAAHQLFVPLADASGDAHHLGPALATMLGCDNLEPLEVAERLGSHRAAPQDATIPLSALAGYLRGDPSPPGQQRAVLRMLLRMVTWDRPLVLVLDDALDSAEASVVIEWLGDGVKVPVLLLVTAASDMLPKTTGHFDTIGEGRHLVLDELAPVAHEQLVRELLMLESATAEAVVERTAGSPLFAIALVGDWIRRGVLVRTDAGFALAPGERGLVPDDLHQFWNDRLTLALATRTDDDDRTRLECAAILGREVRSAEWAAALRDYGLSPATALIERLIEHNLVIPRARGWAFGTTMLVECLRRSAVEESRSRALHLTCASALEHLYPEKHPQIPARRARHLLSADAHGAALRPLLLAAREAHQNGWYQRAERWLELHRTAAGYVTNNRVARETARGLAVQAMLASERAQRDVARAALDEIDRLFDDSFDVQIRVDYLLQRALEALLDARMDAAQAMCDQVLALVDQIDDDELWIRAHVGIADLHRTRAEFTPALEATEKALARSRACNSEHWCGMTLLLRAMIVGTTGQIEEARTDLLEARSHFRRLGSTSGELRVLTTLANVDRVLGNLDEAIDGSRQTLELARRLQHRDVGVIALNLAISLADAERHKEAVEVGAQCHAELLTKGPRHFIPILRIVLLPSRVVLGQLNTFDDELATATQEIADVGQGGFDEVPSSLRKTAALLDEANETKRAARVRELLATATTA